MIDWLQHIYNRLLAFIEAAVMAASTAIQEAESITWTTTLKTLQKEYSEWERRFGMSKKRFTVESTMVSECILDNTSDEQLDTFNCTERSCDLLNELTTKRSRLEEDLKYGLGETKSYYCKGDYIWLDENGNITSKSRQDGGR